MPTQDGLPVPHAAIPLHSSLAFCERTTTRWQRRQADIRDTAIPPITSYYGPYLPTASRRTFSYKHTCRPVLPPHPHTGYTLRDSSI